MQGDSILMKIKYMNTSKCHYCDEGKQKEILLVVLLSFVFAGFQKGFSAENLPF